MEYLVHSRPLHPVAAILGVTIAIGVKIVDLDST